jgi:hypothetical protein
VIIRDWNGQLVAAKVERLRLCSRPSTELWAALEANVQCIWDVELKQMSNVQWPQCQKSKFYLKKDTFVMK